jgi:hypothetical protein
VVVEAVVVVVMVVVAAAAAAAGGGDGGGSEVGGGGGALKTQANQGASWRNNVLGQDISNLIPFCQIEINFCRSFVHIVTINIMDFMLHGKFQ